MSGTPGADDAAPTVALHGERCTLRAFREDELDALLAFRRGSDTVPGLRTSQPGLRALLRRRIARSGRVDNGWLELAIEIDGALAGDIQARGGRSMSPPGVYELGIELYETGRRGKGVGTEAVALFTGHLFSALGAGRVQATTDVDNAAMRAVLVKLGFREEGILRGFMPNPPGSPAPRADYVISAITAEDWTARQR